MLAWQWAIPAFAFENVEFSFEIGGPKEGAGPGLFSGPADIAVGGDGTVYAADSGNARVQFFDGQGKYLGQFGGKGKEPGSLNSPFGIAVGATGLVYVSDRGQDLIKVYDPKGAFQFAFGGSELLSKPCGIAIDNQERLLVADSGHDRLAVFTLAGIFLDTLGAAGGGKGQLSEPVYLTVDWSGRIYVSEAGNKRVQVFNAQGESLAIYGGAANPNPALQVPAGLAVTKQGIVAIADRAAGRIAMLDPKGQFQSPLGSQGSGRGQLKNPSGVRLLDDGRLYIADAGNHRIAGFKTVLPAGLPDLAPGPMALRVEALKVVSRPATDLAVAADGALYLLDGEAGKVSVVDAAGKDKSSIGPAKGSPGNLKKPLGIGLGPEGRVYVYDAADDTFQVFDEQGQFKFTFGGSGKNDGKFSGVRGFCLSQGKLWVADTGNDRVQVFSPDGIFLKKFGQAGKGNGEFKDPVDVAVDSQGQTYVADRGNDRIQVFDAAGAFKFNLVKSGNGAGQFNALQSLGINADNSLLVLESDPGKNNRVQVFDAKLNLVLSFGSEGEGPGQFRRAANLAVRSQGSTEVYIADAGNRRVLALAVKELPNRPTELTLTNQEMATVISWKKRTESIIKGYRVYCLPEAGGPPKLLGETTEAWFKVLYPLDPPGSQFRVTSLSTEGLESPPSQTVTDLFQGGYLAWKAGDYPTAEAKFLAQFNEFPTSALSLKYLGLARLAQGKNDEAVRSFSELIKAPEYAGEAHLQIARVYLQQQHYSEAETELKRAGECDPESAEIYRTRGELFLAQKLYREAQRELEKAAAKDPQCSSCLEVMSRVFAGQKLFQKAQDSLEQAIKMRPQDPSLYRALALVQLERKDLAGAVDSLQKALEVSSHDAEAMVILGEIYFEQKDYAKVERQIKLALQEDPKNFSAQLLQGRSLAARGQNEDAILALQDALGLRPDEVETLQVLAGVYVSLSQPAEAEKVLRQVMAKNPVLACPHLQLARVLAGKGDAGGALAEYQKAIELEPKELPARLELSQLYLSGKQYDQAEAQLQAAIALAPEQAAAHLLLGCVRVESNKVGDAIREFQEAIRLDPRPAEPHFALGRLYYDTGQFDKALPELELAAFAVPGSAEYQNALGLAYFKMLRHDDAIEAFNRAMKLDPSQPEYRKNFDQVYADRKKYLASESNLSPVEIVDFQVGNVFSAIYKSYQDQPAGTLKLKNNLGETLYKAKVSFRVKDFMDTAWYYEIPQLKPHEAVEVKIFPTFNNKVLELSEDSPVLAEITVQYQTQKQPREEKFTRPFTLLKKSALTWSREEMTGAFITPSDWPVKDFARGIFTIYGKDQFAMNEQIAHAMMIFDALRAYKLNYLMDPNNPYGKASGEGAVDYVQYPRETLRLRSGDCDDLSVLFCALLENLGIRTAMVDVPGHVFVIFETQVPAQNVAQVTTQPNLVVLREGKVWIPLETTMVGQSNFTAAWIKAAEVYRQFEAKKQLNLIDTHASWEVFKPATLPAADFQVTLPARAEIDAIMDQEKSLQESGQKQAIAAAFADRLRANPNDPATRQELGLAYAQSGYWTEAKAEFETILKQDPNQVNALSNLGSCAFETGKYPEAVQRYQEAEKLAPQDAELKINLAIAFYKAGNLEGARSSYQAAQALDAGLGEKFKSLGDILFH
jgi:tetratricopeptide (TPR) repeat protein/DNA-binding beta-propeller fold protein YncE